MGNAPFKDGSLDDAICDPNYNFWDQAEPTYDTDLVNQLEQLYDATEDENEKSRILSQIAEIVGVSKDVLRRHIELNQTMKNASENNTQMDMDTMIACMEGTPMGEYMKGFQKTQDLNFKEIYDGLGDPAFKDKIGKIEKRIFCCDLTDKIKGYFKNLHDAVKEENPNQNEISLLLDILLAITPKPSFEDREVAFD